MRGLSNGWIVAIEAALAATMALNWLHPIGPREAGTFFSVFLPTLFDTKAFLDEVGKLGGVCRCGGKNHGA